MGMGMREGGEVKERRKNCVHRKFMREKSFPAMQLWQSTIVKYIHIVYYVLCQRNTLLKFYACGTRSTSELTVNSATKLASYLKIVFNRYIHILTLEIQKQLK